MLQMKAISVWMAVVIMVVAGPLLLPRLLLEDMSEASGWIWLDEAVDTLDELALTAVEDMVCLSWPIEPWLGLRPSVQVRCCMVLRMMYQLEPMSSE